jgi:signal transduction histidine kinase
VSSAYDEDGFKKQTRLMYILIFSFLSGVLITFLVGVFFSNNLVKPIIKITNEVNEITSQNLSKRIILKRERDELFELSGTFNALLKRLQESFDLQKRFIANASHELSTPLTSILSELEITLQKNRTTEQYKDVMISVNEDVVRLKHLTKNLLEIARASGSFEGIELGNIRMDELLMKIPSTIKKENSIYNVNLQFDEFPEIEEKLILKGNPDLLFSAISNIVQNSCKYSSDHTVYISLHFQPQHLQLIIRDNGPGINDADLPFIFQPFYRGANIEKIQGFGLGLSIANEIISLHKGTIQYQKNDNSSSIFTIMLPIITA